MHQESYVMLLTAHLNFGWHAKCSPVASKQSILQMHFYENKKSATPLIHLYSLWCKFDAGDFVKVTTVDKEKYFNLGQILYVLD